MTTALDHSLHITGIRKRETFDFNWTFHKGDVKGGEKPDFSDSDWRKLNLPHDWSIEGPYDENSSTGGCGGYLPAGIGWYRKAFTVPAEASCKKIFIEFDGIYMDSNVWVNGNFVGNYPYGYSSFFYDITPYLKFGGTNIIAVKVDNSKQPNSRWYTGSGIYRHTWLVITDSIHISQWGTYVTTPEATEKSAVFEIKTKVTNEYRTVKNTTLKSLLIDANGHSAGEIETSRNIEPGSKLEFVQRLQIDNPALWDIEHPYLYKIISVVSCEGHAVDDYETVVGARTIQWDAHKGFFLNGRSIKLNGMCLHHDGGCVGAAVPEGVWERRFRLLKEMGCNALRSSHNPPSPEWLDLCDRMGFLVMDEAFDEWIIMKNKNTHSKDTVTYGYANYFEKWAHKDLTAMLRRDRNHCSIILWSVGNEIPEINDNRGPAILKKLVEVCHDEDPSRAVTTACVSQDLDNQILQSFYDIPDVSGYNHLGLWDKTRELYYSEEKIMHPDRIIVATEDTSDWSGIRGEYDPKFPEPGGKHSAFKEPYFTSMIHIEQLLKFTKINKYMCGNFMWTGIDYLGECAWPNKNATSGVIDTAGLIKDSYYLYKSQWVDTPVLHLFPHWNWNGMEGKIIPVVCYTNCDTVELFVNGKSYGMKSHEFPRQGMQDWPVYARPIVYGTTADLHLSWNVFYEPGTIKAVGMNHGKIAAVSEIVTTGLPYAIRLTLDKSMLAADARDVCHVVAEIVDKDGNVVPNACNLINYKLEGPGEFIGVDNGDPACHENYKLHYRKAFNGMNIAIIQSSLKKGELRISAESEGIAGAVASIRAY